MIYSFSFLKLENIIIAGVIAFIIIFLIVFFIIKASLNRKKLIEKVNKLGSTILVSDFTLIDGYVLRLKSVSKKNEAYTKMYESLSNRVNELRDFDMPSLLELQKEIVQKISQDRASNKTYLNDIKDFEAKIDEYKKEIATMEVKLSEAFKESDDLRVSLTNLQKKYQELTADVEKYGPSISICYREIKEYLQKIADYFDVVDEFITSADYEKSLNSMNNIDEMISNLYGKIENIASYCQKVEEFIPNQLEELKGKYARLDENGYVVSFSKIGELANNILFVLNECRTNFKLLSFSQFEKDYENIENVINEANDALDKEVMARDTLDEKYDFLSNKITEAESSFLLTKRQYGRMVEFYILPDEIRSRFEVFQSNATNLSTLKREYDGYVLSNSRNPASFLLSKLNALQISTNDVLEEVTYFSNYFRSYKEYVDESYTNANSLLTKLSIVSGKLRKEKAFPVYRKYKNSILQYSSLLNEMINILTSKPIDIKRLYSDFNNISEDTNNLLNQINVDFEDYSMLEKCIIFANPLRYQFSDVDGILSDVEMLFTKGEYKTALEKINYVLNNYHPEAYESLK